jgi:DNA polymerase-3 subunit beta
MRLTIPQPQLLKTLQVVERAVNERSTLPILANVLIETKENELTLTATDLDVGIQCRFPLVAPVEGGAVALPARKFTTVVRELPDEVVTLEAKKNHTATVNCGSSSFRIPGLPAEDFPALPVADAGEGIVVAQEDLKRLITLTAHAMSIEETRFILNGSLFAAQKNELLVAATDGRRLAVARAELTKPAKQPLRVIIPSKTVRELGRLLQDDEGDEVVIAPLKENQVAFRFGAVSIVTRLIEGEFPQFDKVIPAPSKQTLSANRQLLMNAVRRASLMTTATSQAVLFELAPDSLIVSKESAEHGSAREELPVDYRGEALTVAFNPEFWLDVLKALADEDVTVEIAGPDRPAVIRQDAFTYLVLPMKVA